MNKNPFEIRADILQLAKDYMDQQYHTNLNFAREMFEKSAISVAEYNQAVKAMYSIDELMAKAQEMYSFVSKKE